MGEKKGRKGLLGLPQWLKQAGKTARRLLRFGKKHDEEEVVEDQGPKLKKKTNFTPHMGQKRSEGDSWRCKSVAECWCGKNRVHTCGRGEGIDTACWCRHDPRIDLSPADGKMLEAAFRGVLSAEVPSDDMERILMEANTNNKDRKKKSGKKGKGGVVGTGRAGAKKTTEKKEAGGDNGGGDDEEEPRTWLQLFVHDMGANVNSFDRSGITPLHYASRLGCAEDVKALLDEGADPLQADMNGNLPLHYGVLAASSWHLHAGGEIPPGKVKCGLCGGKCWLKRKGAACLRVKAMTLQLDVVPGLKDYVNGNGKAPLELLSSLDTEWQKQLKDRVTEAEEAAKFDPWARMFGLGAVGQHTKEMQDVEARIKRVAQKLASHKPKKPKKKKV